MTLSEKEKLLFVCLFRSEDPKEWPFLLEQLEATESIERVIAGDFEPDGESDHQLELFTERDSVSDFSQRQIDEAGQLLEAWEAEGYSFVTIFDEIYPSNLLQVFDRPPFLFVRGELRPEDRTGIAVVGTRRCTHEGVRRAQKLGRSLAERGVCVISGMAKGIDTAAHEGCLAGSGRTIAVVGTGLSTVYPPENKNLHDKIADNGAIISQFWPEFTGMRRGANFLMRNKTMSGLALGTVVVEAPDKSGARSQASHALKHGRLVFLLKSLVSTAAWAKTMVERPGCFQMDDVQDVLAAIEILTRPLSGPLDLEALNA